MVGRRTTAVATGTASIWVPKAATTAIDLLLARSPELSQGPHHTPTTTTKGIASGTTSPSRQSSDLAIYVIIVCPVVPHSGRTDTVRLRSCLLFHPYLP